MTSATDPEWDAIIRTWGHAYTLSHDPAAAPAQRYSARPLGPGHALHAEPPAVWDNGPGHPRPASPADDAETGRGLAIIDALTARQWGWWPTPQSGGKVVWASLTPATPPP